MGTGKDGAYQFDSRKLRYFGYIEPEIPSDLRVPYEREQRLAKSVSDLQDLVSGKYIALDDLLASYGGGSRPDKIQATVEELSALAYDLCSASRLFDRDEEPMAKALGFYRSFLMTALAVAPISGAPADALWLDQLAHQTASALEEIARPFLDSPEVTPDPAAFRGFFGQDVMQSLDGSPLMDPSGKERRYRTTNDLARTPAWTVEYMPDTLATVEMHDLLASARLREDSRQGNAVVWEWQREPAPVDLSDCDGKGLINRAEPNLHLDLWLYAEGAYSIITGSQGWGLLDVPGGIGEWRAAADRDDSQDYPHARRLLDVFPTLSYGYRYCLEDFQFAHEAGELDHSSDFHDMPWELERERWERAEEGEDEPYDKDFYRHLLLNDEDKEGLDNIYWELSRWIPWQPYTPVGPDGLLRAWHPSNESSTSSELLGREREQWRSGLGDEGAFLACARGYCLTLAGHWTLYEAYAAWSLVHTTAFALSMLLNRRGLKPIVSNSVYLDVWTGLEALSSQIEQAQSQGNELS